MHRFTESSSLVWHHGASNCNHGRRLGRGGSAGFSRAEALPQWSPAAARARWFTSPPSPIPERSLRDAVSQGNRIVVFDVSGVINPRRHCRRWRQHHLGGQSAPGDGITIYGRETSFSSRSNMIVRYLRFVRA